MNSGLHGFYRRGPLSRNSLESTRSAETDPTRLRGDRRGIVLAAAPVDARHEVRRAGVVMTPTCVSEFLSATLSFPRHTQRKTPGKSPGKVSTVLRLNLVSETRSCSSGSATHRDANRFVLKSFKASSSPSPVPWEPARPPRQPRQRRQPHPVPPSHCERSAGPNTSGAPTVRTKTGPSSAAMRSREPWDDPRRGSPHPRPQYRRPGPGKNFHRHRATARQWERDTPRHANPEHQPFHYSSFVNPQFVPIESDSSPAARIRRTCKCLPQQWKTLLG